MVEFDSFLVTHGPETKVDVQDLSEKIIGKRKIGGKPENPFKRTKYPAYFIYDLAHVVAFADEQIPFNTLASEMTKKGIAHSGMYSLFLEISQKNCISEEVSQKNHKPNIPGIFAVLKIA